MTNTAKPARAKPDKAVFVKLTRAILTLAGYSRDKAEAILKKHGVSYAQQLRPEKRQVVLDEVEAEITKARAAQVTGPAIPMSTPTQPAPAPPTPAQRLERLKVIVEHLYDTWPHLLRRQLTLQSLGRHEDLHEALEQTYVAHITNTLQDVLVIDLLRELGALVLDDDRGSASIARAMSALRDPDVIAELRREHEVVRPLGHIGADKLTPTQRAELDAHWEQSERRDQLARFEQWRAELATIDTELTGSEVGEKLRQARNKGVAHYDVVRSGDDWRLWRVDGTGLTWGQINTYVDTCSEAIEVLLALVRQTSFDFDGSKEVAQGYVDEFIDALVRGLRSQKQELAEKRNRLLRGRE